MAPQRGTGPVNHAHSVSIPVPVIESDPRPTLGEPAPPAPASHALFRDAVHGLQTESWPVQHDEIGKMSVADLISLDVPALIDNDVGPVMTRLQSAHEASSEAAQNTAKSEKISILLKKLLSHGLRRDVDDTAIGTVMSRGLGALMPLRR